MENLVEYLSSSTLTFASLHTPTHILSLTHTHTHTHTPTHKLSLSHIHSLVHKLTHTLKFKKLVHNKSKWGELGLMMKKEGDYEKERERAHFKDMSSF